MHKRAENTLPCTTVADLFPDWLMNHLALVHRSLPGDVYLTGGTVRDLLLQRKSADIDLTVVRNARKWAGLLAEQTGGTYVELGREEDAARVVCRGLGVDFSSFREGAASIDEELCKRDITVNSMALPLHDLLLDPDRMKESRLVVIDPAGGIRDLGHRLIRVSSKQSFSSDALRMLRVFRFAAVLDFAIDPDTLGQVRQQREKIKKISVERVAYELDLIMGSSRAYTAFSTMADCGLLWEILPEFRAGVGMDQPASHHLDVFSHSLEALRQMERVLDKPQRLFPAHPEEMAQYISREKNTVLLKWAALFHDIGKPATYGINEDKGGRITFYNHDLQGADIFATIAGRLRWSSRDTRFVARLIAGHMRPFFLANNERQGELTLKACLRLVKSIGEHLPGLFLLAMADALAGKGEGSPEQIEQEVASLFDHLMQVEEEHVAPVQTAPPLITGKDLINELHLVPGPLFREILEQVEDACMEGMVTSRKQALSMAEEYAKKASSTDEFA